MMRGSQSPRDEAGDADEVRGLGCYGEDAGGCGTQENIWGH